MASVKQNPSTPPSTDGDGPVRAVLRAFSILECFGDSHSSLTLQAIVDRIGLPKTTVFRLVQTLLQAGYLVQKENQELCLSFRLLSLGSVVQNSLGVRDVVKPEMTMLAERTGETVEMSLRSGPVERTCIEVIESRHALKSIVRVGDRVRLSAGATSKVFLAYMSPEELSVALRDGPPELDAWRDTLPKELARIRRQGWASSAGERIPGASAICVPLFGFSGRHEHCLTIVGPSARIANRLEEFRDLLLAAGEAISIRLGHPRKAGR
jgi:DNA-binding IclR family transcriptional regulator